jgi:NAD(P)-dependent dehydrogenase (short-subunit alcohol dehydrogenase family)
VKSFEGRRAVVTGASSGIGRRIALDLAARGATVTGIARRPTDATGVTSVQCDLGDVDAYRHALAALEPVDILVQAAGMEERTSALDGDLEVYRRTFDVNFFAAVTGTLAVVPGMVDRGSGVVVNVSADSARAPTAGAPAYAASKAALAAFTEAVAHEVGPRGVHVHVLYPGWVPTAMGQGAVDAGMAPPPKAVRRTTDQVSLLTLERMGRPGIDINAARLAVLAPVVRALSPRIYRRAIGKRRAR